MTEDVPTNQVLATSSHHPGKEPQEDTPRMSRSRLGHYVIHSYWEGARITYRTDHEAFGWIRSTADETVNLARWWLRLVKRDFEIVHRAWIKHQAPDALSTLPTNRSNRTIYEDDIAIMSATRSSKLELISPTENTKDGSNVEINSTFGYGRSAVLTFIYARRAAIYCHLNCQYVGLLDTALTYDKDRISVIKALIYGTIQKVVPASLRSKITNFALYSVLARQPGRRQTHNLLWW